jgi:hypothetical protein
MMLRTFLDVRHARCLGTAGNGSILRWGVLRSSGVHSVSRRRCGARNHSNGCVVCMFSSGMRCKDRWMGKIKGVSDSGSRSSSRGNTPLW